MDWYKIIFFHVFNRYYKDGNYKNDIPWLTASVIIGVSTYFHLFSLFVLGYYFFTGHSLTLASKYPNIICAFVFVSLNCYCFIYQNRYLKIYTKFRKSDKNKKIIALLSWMYIFLGFFSVPIAALINSNLITL
jgi:hypothetical protein